MVCERWVETGTDCYIDPTSSLDHSTLCYLQEPTWHFFRVLAGVAQPGVAEGHSSQFASLPSLWPFLSSTDSTAAGTCLYSFITPTCFRFFFRSFTQVHLWLMARQGSIYNNNKKNEGANIWTKPTHSLNSQLKMLMECITDLRAEAKI